MIVGSKNNNIMRRKIVGHMAHKSSTLIIHASVHGTTRYCTELLAEKIGKNTVVAHYSDAPSLDDFEQVIIGTPIYAGKPPAEFRPYIDSLEAELLTKKVGLFGCGLNDDPQKIQQQLANSFSEALRSHATATVWFGGRLTLSDLSFPEKMIMKMMNKKTDEDSLRLDRIKQFAQTFRS